MNLKSSIFFAKRLIFPRTAKKSSARRSILGSIICIAISVVPLVVVISVSEGMFYGMTERIIGLSSDHLQGVLNRRSEIVKSYSSFKNFSETFLNCQGVSQVFPEINSDALACSKTFRTGAKIRAVEPDIFYKNKAFSKLLKITDGSLDSFVSGKKNCVIGEKIASTLNLKAGDFIRLVTSNKVASYKIAAVVSSGFQELDALWVFIPLDTSYAFLARETSFHSVLLTVEDSSMKNLIKMQENLGDEYYGKVRIYRWDEMNASQFENFSSTRIMLVFIMLLIVLVASVNISSALVMLVMERRREIAILKSYGASSFGISFSFLLAGGFCGLAGTLIGLPAGLLLSVNANSILQLMEKLLNGSLHFFNILLGKTEKLSQIHLMDPAYYLQEIPLVIPYEKMFLISLSVIMLSLVVSIIPSFKAGAERPLEIFKKV